MRTLLRWLAALFFFGAGLMHFFNPELYLRIVPPYLPVPKLLVAISGFAELAGGIGLLLPSVRRAAGWGLLALLVAVFPANIYMLQHSELYPIARWLLWARLPFQVLFMAWVWFVALQRSSRECAAAGTPP